MQGSVLNDPGANREQAPVRAHSPSASRAHSPSASVMSTCLVIRCPPCSVSPSHSWPSTPGWKLVQFPSLFLACSLKGQQTMLSPLILRKQRRKHCYLPSFSAADHKCLTFSDMFKPQSRGNSKQSSFQEISSDLFRPFDVPRKFTSLELPLGK